MLIVVTSHAQHAIDLKEIWQALYNNPTNYEGYEILRYADHKVDQDKYFFWMDQPKNRELVKLMPIIIERYNQMLPFK